MGLVGSVVWVPSRVTVKGWVPVRGPPVVGAAFGVPAFGVVVGKIDVPVSTVAAGFGSARALAVGWIGATSAAALVLPRIVGARGGWLKSKSSARSARPG